MTQQEDMTGQEPGTSPAGATGAGSSAMPASSPGSPVPGTPGPDTALPSAEPARPSPYLSQGQAMPEAYLAPPQPGQPSYGAPAGSARPGVPFSPGQQGSGQPGYGPPGGPQATGQPGYHPAYQPPGYGQPRRPMPGRMGARGRAARRDPALAAEWERLLAMTVDWILILAAAFLTQLSPMLRIWHQLQPALVYSQAGNQTAAQTALSNVVQSSSTTTALLHYWLAAFGIALIYFWVLPAVWGATVGKRVVGLRIVTAADRSAVGVKAAGLRAAAFLAGPAIFLLAPDVALLGGLVWVADGTFMLLDARGQCLHDRVAGTTVIRKRWLDQQARTARPW